MTLLIVYTVSATVFASEPLKIKPLWSIDATFQLPESATYHPDSQTIYVSNIVKYAKDGSGFISKLDQNGKIIALKRDHWP